MEILVENKVHWIEKEIKPRMQIILKLTNSKTYTLSLDWKLKIENWKLKIEKMKLKMLYNTNQCV